MRCDYPICDINVADRQIANAFLHHVVNRTLDGANRPHGSATIYYSYTPLRKLDGSNLFQPRDAGLAGDRAPTERRL